MKDLLSLAGRILLFTTAFVVSVSWLISRWYAIDVVVGLPQHLSFVHCDSGGWYADFRRYPDLSIGFEVDFSSAAIAELDNREADLSRNYVPMIDAFDAADMWKARLPGLRFLSNSGLGLRRRGRQIGVGIRHWLLFSSAMLCLGVWCWRRHRADRARSELSHRESGG